MSRFLKVIVNLVVLISIAIAAALLVPPFIGMDTVMNDNTEIETNIPIGSVAYGQSIDIAELKKGDKIIENEGAGSYVYEIADMDASAGVFKVKDVYNKNSDIIEITLQKTAPKVLVVVPFIGYAAIALQSKEGLIVVGLGIVFLIILFILSELFRKDDDDDDEDDEEYEDEDDDDNEDEEEEELTRKERKRLKKEEKRRRKEEKRRRKEEEYEEEYEDDDDEDEEEEELTRKERKRLKKEEKRRRKLEKKGLLEDDDDEDEEMESSVPSREAQETADDDQTGFEDAMKDAMSAIAMEVAGMNAQENVSEETAVQNTEEDQQESQNAEDELQTNLQIEANAENEDTVNSINNIEVTPAYDPETVLRTPSVKELLEKAGKAGEKPRVKEDKDNDVTFLDYSDLL